MNKRLKVLQILSGFGIGGAETWLLELMRYVKSQPGLVDRVQFDFLLTGGKKEVLDGEFERLGAKLHYIRFSLGEYQQFRKAFVKLLDTERYDALHSHQDFVSGWIFAAAAGHLPARRISSLHNAYWTIHNYLSKPHRYMSYHGGRLLMRIFATHISGTSKAVMDDYGYGEPPYLKKNAGPVYCGIDTEKFLTDREQSRKSMIEEMDWKGKVDRIGLFVGRIDLDGQYGAAVNPKNSKFAFEIARELVKKHADWGFLFVGKKGQLGAELENQVDAQGLGDQIRFLGIRDDMPRIMGATDVLVFPSLWEGLGMVAVEAQASGLPVLASDNIPDEACVVKELYHALSLERPASDWVEEVVRIAGSSVIEASDANSMVRRSSFAIGNTFLRLMDLYDTERI